jgi:hypothetical protein
MSSKEGLWLLFLCLAGYSAGFSSSQSIGAQETTIPLKRLILTDGSFEPITQYSIQGDRVRYFSADRHEWEEMPSSLVDWAATEEYAREAAARSSARVGEQLAEAAEEKRQMNSRHPEVAPGLRLSRPDDRFMLSRYQDKPELIALVQNEADLNKNTRGNTLRGIFNPIASSRQTAELKGLHARIQSHVPDPAFFVPAQDANSQMPLAADAAKDRFRIVRCEQKNGNRILAVYKIAIVGKVEQQARNIETRVEPVSEHWLKITPSNPLEPGEYALVELDEKGVMNLFVWDFGVNPDAPENPAIGVEIPERREPALILKPQKKTNP